MSTANNSSIFMVVLVNNLHLISGIEFTKDEMGKTEVILNKPFVLEGSSMMPYLNGYTNQNTFHISPSKIITLAAPKPEIQDKYLKLVSE
jgi:hypothetical protein